MQQVILITGCSTGIGAALAEQCRQAGHKVLATARNKNNLQHLHPDILSFTLDVTSASSIAQCLQEIRGQVQHIDVLINNAGYGAMGPLLEMPAEDVERQFATNTYAPLHMLQACFDLLQRSRRARIVNIGSVSGVTATPFSGIYCASKAALHTLDDVLRMELFPFGMQVITVQPGAIGSAFGDNAEAQLNKVLPQNSRYAAIKDSIFKRARASQQNPTPAADFAAQILPKILADKCPTLIRAGNGSFVLPLLKRLLPAALLNHVLRKQFGLNRSL